MIQNADQLSEMASAVVSRFKPGAKLVRAWPLAGGVSAQVVAVDMVDESATPTRIVIRRHGAIDVGRNPAIAADEFNLLQTLYDVGLPVPQPFYLDETNDIFPTPYLVTAFVDADPGLPEFSPMLIAHQMAAHLVAIHAVNWRTAGLGFLPEQRQRFERRIGSRPETLDHTLSEGPVRAQIEAHLPLNQVNAPVLLHGDYWPGNTMWRDSNVIAVIDWEDAAIGDPLADVANCRLELLWAYDVTCMESFTTTFLELSSIDSSNLPLWDLYAALGPAGKLSEWGLDVSTEQRMRWRHADFVEQAIKQLK